MWNWVWYQSNFVQCRQGHWVVMWSLNGIPPPLKSLSQILCRLVKPWVLTESPPGLYAMWRTERSQSFASHWAQWGAERLALSNQCVALVIISSDRSSLYYQVPPKICARSSTSLFSFSLSLFLAVVQESLWIASIVLMQLKSARTTQSNSHNSSNSTKLRHLNTSQHNWCKSPKSHAHKSECAHVLRSHQTDGSSHSKQWGWTIESPGGEKKEEKKQLTFNVDWQTHWWKATGDKWVSECKCTKVRANIKVTTFASVDNRTDFKVDNLLTLVSWNWIIVDIIYCAKKRKHFFTEPFKMLCRTVQSIWTLKTMGWVKN